ncbi:MAG: restriction endonuclease subunit S [Euryarchaeota archaeon]|nr:restriction endonuclease subunit S [Euryarchaeota archaeon]
MYFEHYQTLNCPEGAFLTYRKNNMTGSAGQQRLSQDFVKRFKIPLPPLYVQRQIVARI